MKKTIQIMTAFLLIMTIVSGCGAKKQEEPLPDTVRWMNATYAILTKANNGNLNAIGGMNKVEGSKKLLLASLEEWWDITDRASADEQLDWLIGEGHRAQFASDIAYLQENGVMDLSEEEQKALIQDSFEEADQAYVYSILEAYDTYGDHAIDAWDYCRANQLLGQFYIVDFYTKEEALDKSLEISEILQGTYDSWEDMAKSYLYGYQYWQEDDMDEEGSASYERRMVYEKLLEQKDNPYQIDWNLKLEKSW
ncbi:DUF1266 domain-containing protein [Diplocloster hominis]|uniref:DUF1266 domain-containing protein n=1 Tax=Diplocloster hominis TaxID=3079010 RepID=UPI0031BB375F